MARGQFIDRLVKWLLLAAGIGTLAVMAWTIVSRWQANDDTDTETESSLPTFADDPGQVTRLQPVETPRTPQAAASALTPAQDFTLFTLSGEQVSLSDYAGRPVLINFWATWCAPCKIEMPAIQRVYEAQAGDLVVLAVNLEESPGVIQPYIDELGLTFPVLLDEDGAVTVQYTVRGLPTSLFVTSDGLVYRQHIGPMTEDFITQTLREMQERNGGTNDD